MLETLRGTLIRKDADEAVIETGGIGFAVSIPASTQAALPDPGAEARLFVHLSFNVQEGEFKLYGFATELERDVFRIFLGISGFGPRKGLMLLSQVRISDFACAIRDRNLAYLSSLKGVGRKTAERLLVELREKMLPYVSAGGGAGVGGTGGSGGAFDPDVPLLPPGDHIRDAVAGLVSLGCRYGQAARAVSKAIDLLGPDAPAEDLIREGLRHR